MEPRNQWSEEVIRQLGDLPIWTATWTEFYVQHRRHLQTYAQAQELARQHRGQVILQVRHYAPPHAGE